MSQSVLYAVFDTAIGRCGIAWGPSGIVGASLPEDSANDLTARFTARHPDAKEGTPTPDIADAIRRIKGLLQGAADDLADIALDETGLSDFSRRVYVIARRIPPGATRTYGDIAKEMGGLHLAREVGQALGRNPYPIIVPCHRILAAGGKTGGFSAPGGVQTKFRMLAIERAKTDTAPSLFDELPLAAPPKRTH
jgi:methylated-DNA-[protein]-cysteine S-methyltransferase